MVGFMRNLVSLLIVNLSRVNPSSNSLVRVAELLRSVVSLCSTHRVEVVEYCRLVHTIERRQPWAFCLVRQINVADDAFILKAEAINRIVALRHRRRVEVVDHIGVKEAV